MRGSDDRKSCSRLHVQSAGQLMRGHAGNCANWNILDPAHQAFALCPKRVVLAFSRLLGF